MNDLYAKQIISHLVQQGVRTIFIAPGSRLTPLVYAAAKEELLDKRVHFDERGLAFAAYGHAKGSKRPAALVCTSGTAIGNFVPAIMEAFHDGVPLIIISADRPPELRDCGANQTCDQVKFFGNYVKWYFEIPCPDLLTPPGFIGSSLAQAVFRATETPQGPVHLNCLLREPFLSDHVAKPTPPTHYDKAHFTLPPSVLEQWAKRLFACERGVILVGSCTSSSMKPILTLAQQLDWPIFPDITSNLRSEGMHPNVIPYYDALVKLMPGQKPDCILHFGDKMVSKPLLNWAKAPLYALVASHPFRHDPAHTVTHRIQCDPPLFAELMLPYLPRRMSWLSDWKTASQVIDGHLSDWIPFATEPGLVRFLHHTLPPHFSLFAANGMPIRDLDQFFFPPFHRGPIFGKRGLSGIDGNIATIAGLADGTKRPLVALLGDQSALHDLNSLPLLKKSKVPILLIIINNHGGGIFSFLPIAEKKEIFEEYFAAAHPWNFEAAAKMFDIPYFHLNDETKLSRLLHEEKTCLIEFETSRVENVALHRTIEKNIAETIGALV
jgi:2-succinyl-5-enolpyruvyl-6-hydroxy-3-cyclohexene-1-carboxylate synthase